MKTHNNTSPTSPSPKPRQHRNHSRFLPSIESAECHSPSPVIQRKSLTPPAENNNSRRHKITEDPVFTRHQLWPSFSKNNNSGGTLADHINQDRIIEQKDKPTNTKTSSNNVFQKSYKREFNRFENDEASASSSISRELFGGSARYTNTGRLFASSSMKKLNSNGSVIVPGRLSLDENSKPFSSSRKSSSNVSTTLDFESQYSDGNDDARLVSPARKLGAEVPSRRARRGASDSNIGNLNGGGDSVKPSMKRVNSVTVGLGHNKSSSSKSQWALSPGRSEFNSSPNYKAKGVEKLLTFGFDLFKSKKSLVLNSPQIIGLGNLDDDVHKLRLLDNRLIQWRYANAKAQAVNANISSHAQSNLVCAWDGLTKLRYSVMKKKIQFAREKLEMKIAFILYYQLKLLEAWGAMERQHVSSITAIKESLHSVLCKVPLMEGAKVNIPLTSIALRQAIELTASTKSTLTTFSPTVEKTVAMLSELAKVVTREKRLLEEFYDHFQTIFVFELQERSVKCDLITLQDWKRKCYQQQQLLPNITS